MSLAAPTGLRTTAVTPTRVTLAWNRAPSADFYDVFRNGVYAFATAALTLSDPTVAPSSAYTYAVRSRRGAQTSAFGNVLPVLTPAPPPALPATPSGFGVGLAGTPRAPVVVLGWTPDASTTSIDVYRNGVLLAAGVAP